MGKVRDFIRQPTLLGEIIRFLLVGGVSTVVDFLVMGVTLYVFNPENYDNFMRVFIGKAGDPSGVAATVGTGLGFIFGLIINYLFSILFVFNDKSTAKSFKGFFKFAFFSIGALVLHEIGMLLLFGLFGINEWIVKIVMTFVALIYNFTTRRMFIFHKKEKPKNEG